MEENKTIMNEQVVEETEVTNGGSGSGILTGIVIGGLLAVAGWGAKKLIKKVKKAKKEAAKEESKETPNDHCQEVVDEIPEEETNE